MGKETNKWPCEGCEKIPNTTITLNFDLTARQIELLKDCDNIGGALKKVAERELYRILREVA